MARTVRPYEASDADATLHVFRHAVRETAIKDYSPAQVEAWVGAVDLTTWQARRTAAHTFVAVEDSRVVGFCDVTDDGLVDMLFVHPAAGGRGVARALVIRVVQEARGLGLSRLHTHASRTARPAFELFGFVVDRSNDENRAGSQNLPNYDMHLDLD